MSDICINSVYPWGRSLEEYVGMFALTTEDLQKTILDCGSGPSSFCAEMTTAGRNVIACDPIYAFPAEEIRRRVQETSEEMVNFTRKSKDRFVWDRIETPEHLQVVRLQAMAKFFG